MKRKHKFFILILFAFLLLPLGCGKEDPKKTKEKGERVHYKMGVQKLETGDYESAINYFEKALHFNPSSEKTLIDLGVLYEDIRKDIPKAMDAYRRFLYLRPDGEKAEMVKGWLMKLAVNGEGAKAESLTKTAGSQTSQGFHTMALQENERLKKESKSIKAKLNQNRRQSEALIKKFESQEQDAKDKLATAQITINSLQEAPIRVSIPYSKILWPRH